MVVPCCHDPMCCHVKGDGFVLPACLHPPWPSSFCCMAYQQEETGATSLSAALAKISSLENQLSIQATQAALDKAEAIKTEQQLTVRLPE